MVAMETLSSVDKDMLYQIVSRYILGKAGSFGGFCLNIKNVIDVFKSVGAV